MNPVVHLPTDVARLTLNAITEARDNAHRSIITHTALDETLLPLRPRKMTAVLALSSSWKSGFMQWLVREDAKTYDPLGSECDVYVTGETSVEDLGIIDVSHAAFLPIGDILDGKADMDKIRTAAVKRGQTMIYVIGHSAETRHIRPKLTMANIIDAIKGMEASMKVKPRLICIDYLQRLERDSNARELRVQHEDNVQSAVDLSQIMDCHVVLGAQAREEVKKRDVKLPNMGDCHEAPAALQHAADNIISLWRPWVTEKDKRNDSADPVTVAGISYTVTGDLLLAAIEKQKQGDMGDVYALSVDFATATVKGAYTAHTTATKG